MPFADVGGHRLHYEDTGGDGPAVVFSHGLFMDGSMFDAQVAALKDRYRCITWDERGHGQTGEVDEDFSYWDSASDLVGLMDHLGIDQAVLVGMSQGGYLSQRLAINHPERVQGLVLFATQAGTDEHKRQAYDALLDQWTSQGLGDELAQTIAAIVIGPGDPSAEHWIAKWRTNSPENLRRIYTTLVGRDDLTPRLGEIRAPAMVIWGEGDLAIEEERARALADGLDAELVAVPGAGHGVNFTHAAAVNPHLTRFLEQVVPARV
ncbi:alpha/beta fold hydrolase [Conexibacter sp. SYSU D00693]|uniref:alpha/beta fold hydrolase n=1 Tax=Conexibacter sp. SYSU D00693 TaxID=2812560 RepID=UPI00196B5615|nr:alpha/beta hydrolase [Conexibacter sp. SYSU D00693]